MRNKATKKNMDLDLRRYGNKLYSKAEKSGGSDGGDSEYLSNVLELLYTPGIQYNFLTTDNIYTEDPLLLTKEEYEQLKSHIDEEAVNTIGDYDTANYILVCMDTNKEEFICICLTEEELNLLKEVVKTQWTITMKEYLETMIEFQYPNGYYFNNKEYPVYIPDLVYYNNEYVPTNDIPIFVLDKTINFDFAYSTKPFDNQQKAAVIYGFDNDLSISYNCINKVLIKVGNFSFGEDDGVFKPVPGII